MLDCQFPFFFDNFWWVFVYFQNLGLKSNLIQCVGLCYLCCIWWVVLKFVCLAGHNCSLLIMDAICLSNQFKNYEKRGRLLLLLELEVLVAPGKPGSSSTFLPFFEKSFLFFQSCIHIRFKRGHSSLRVFGFCDIEDYFFQFFVVWFDKGIEMENLT